MKTLIFAITSFLKLSTCHLHIPQGLGPVRRSLLIPSIIHRIQIFISKESSGEFNVIEIDQWEKGSSKPEPRINKKSDGPKGFLKPEKRKRRDGDLKSISIKARSQ